MPESSEPELSDQVLLAAVADGDAMAVRRLMDRYDRLVRYTIYRISKERSRRDPLWLDSVASEAWTDICRSLRIEVAPKIENIHSYFIQIARRRCIDALRRRSDTPTATGGDNSEAPQLMDKEEDTARTLMAAEELFALRECVRQLGPHDARLYVELEAITAGCWREAAGRLQMPESTLRSRWKKVLERLRMCMERPAGD